MCPKSLLPLEIHFSFTQKTKSASHHQQAIFAATEKKKMIILLIILILLFGFEGYRMGPDIGYYDEDTISLILLIVLVLLLLKVV
jgi:hypothetical protein